MWTFQASGIDSFKSQAKQDIKSSLEKWIVVLVERGVRGMVKIEGSVMIDRRADQVWKFIMDFSNASKVDARDPRTETDL